MAGMLKRNLSLFILLLRCFVYLLAAELICFSHKGWVEGGGGRGRERERDGGRGSER